MINFAAGWTTMKNKLKIFNDPVYGFISVQHGILLDLIEHPYFQRLRRISQLGLSHYVYPGALHTRFHHALGALHLMCSAITVLKQKGIEISDEESDAVSIAILLHDIGHGPFSHTLEHSLLDVHHEELSLMLMEELNRQFGGQLSLAIQIFKDQYEKKYLHQVVSGQLDMDRLDYLNRDSFFTGVSEGVIGYDRIIKMLTVRDNELLVEEKGIYSIEKFLIARRLMYWQVYLHKTVLAAEQMLIRAIRRAKELTMEGKKISESDSLRYFLELPPSKPKNKDINELLNQFVRLDDVDIFSALKIWSGSSDFVLAYLSGGILNRKLLKINLQNEPFDKNTLAEEREKFQAFIPPDANIDYLVFQGKESNQTYNRHKDLIKILFKNEEVRSITDSMDYELHSKIITKHYLCHPKSFSTFV